MRNKFSEWIEQGIAKFKQTARTPVCAACDPETAALIHTYNNIWGMPTDTQMAKLDDGRLVITGRFTQSREWYDFCQSNHWYAVDFTASGVWCLDCWLCNFKKMLKCTFVNGEQAWEVVDLVEPEVEMAPVSMTTSENKIPQFINVLENHPGAIQDILSMKGSCEDIVARLNESHKVKGRTWYMNKSQDDYVLGVRIGETNYFVKLTER